MSRSTSRRVRALALDRRASYLTSKSSEQFRRVKGSLWYNVEIIRLFRSTGIGFRILEKPAISLPRWPFRNLLRVRFRALQDWEVIFIIAQAARLCMTTGLQRLYVFCLNRL